VIGSLGDRVDDPRAVDAYDRVVDATERRAALAARTAR
jgi:hypothetical protein